MEEFIPGREFNISILCNGRNPLVLPPAEMIFRDFPEGKPHIIGYAAKWDESSFEYENTIRTFDFNAEDELLLKNIEKIATDCWREFGLSGYARVDMRVDRNNQPFVLEINANPCISPDSGFYAACKRAGLSFSAAVKKILEGALTYNHEHQLQK